MAIHRYHRYSVDREQRVSNESPVLDVVHTVNFRFVCKPLPKLDSRAGVSSGASHA